MEVPGAERWGAIVALVNGAFVGHVGQLKCHTQRNSYLSHALGHNNATAFVYQIGMHPKLMEGGGGGVNGSVALQPTAKSIWRKIEEQH